MDPDSYAAHLKMVKVAIGDTAVRTLMLQRQLHMKSSAAHALGKLNPTSEKNPIGSIFLAQRGEGSDSDSAKHVRFMLLEHMSANQPTVSLHNFVDKINNVDEATRVTADVAMHDIHFKIRGLKQEHDKTQQALPKKSRKAFAIKSNWIGLLSTMKIWLSVRGLEIFK